MYMYIPLPPCSHRYVDLSLTLGQFKATPSHPAHSHFLVTDSTTMSSLCQQLHSRLGATATAIAIFSDPGMHPSSRLPGNLTLRKLGMSGGTRDTPTKAQLYFDYVAVVLDCPLIMADYYYPSIQLAKARRRTPPNPRKSLVCPKN